MKRVMLTGAGGFIGSHCIQPLLDRGYEVHAVERLPRQGDPCGASWHAVDLLDRQAVSAAVEAVRPTHLLHLAWYVVPGKFVTSPENFEWVAASQHLVRAFAEAGGSRAAVCGSGYEYDWRYGYCTEELTPCLPDTVYGAAKLALHHMVRSYAETRRLSWAWPRVFFLYGPGEHPQRLVSSVIRAVLRGEPAPCSHGRQIRDYMHLQDVADGIVAALDGDVQGAVNVCSGEAVTIRDIVLTIGRLTERPDLIRLGALPARPNDVPLVVGANARLTGLGWAARHDLESGLQETIAWWRRQG